MKSQPLVIQGKIRFADFDSSYKAGLEKEETKSETEKLTLRMGELQNLLYANSSHAVLLLFQGMDASGKDGSVRAVLQHVNPAGIEVANFKVPSENERAHDFLWRVHQKVPRFGNIGIFNRSHYEAVLVERILKIVPKKVWSGRYQQIVDFERMLAQNNVMLLKFFLHLGKKEQAERFQERLAVPHKRWKFSHGDLETRKHWNKYQQAYEDMLNRTSHEAAHWHIVPADRNWYRDHIITQAVVRALENLKMKWPQPKEDFSRIRIV